VFAIVRASALLSRSSFAENRDTAGTKISLRRRSRHGLRVETERPVV
jgi:hypothetical protein